MNKIDLSKILVKKLPTKKITADFDGAKKQYEIRALNDGEKLNLLSLLASGGKDVYRVRNMYIFLLTCGLDVDQPVAEALFAHANTEAVRIGDAIFELSKVFEDAKAEEADVAEKNSAEPPAEAQA